MNEATPLLRSAQWFSGDDEVAVLHRAALTLTAADQGRPVIGIADTTSGFNPCHQAFGSLVESIEAGIREAGGIPVRFPVMSLGEDLMKPSAMLYRNLVSMELEESIRAYPVDGVVYLANCDKTVPAALMAAASTNVPGLLFFGGARQAPLFQNKPLGSGTDLWRALEDRRSGAMDEQTWRSLERCLACAGAGSCNTMGTASTLAILTETLGMSLPGIAGVQADSPQLTQAAHRTGLEAVRRVIQNDRPRDFLTQGAFDNAFKVLAAIGGSTNAVIHLTAVAGRLLLDASLQRCDQLWAQVPLVVDVEPCGAHLIQDFAADGGVPVLVSILTDLLDTDQRSGDGRPWHEAAIPVPSQNLTLRSVEQPLMPAPTMAAIFGTLAPNGCVLKVAAASAEYLEHTGPALVFDSYADMRTRLNSPELSASASSVIVVRGCGPVGVPGMPEWGMAPIPQRLVEAGIRDMLRISDGRMSGTSFGTVLLHIAPEAATGGPLALVADGDQISFSLSGRTLDLDISAEELDRRRELWEPSPSPHQRGWPRLYQDHVLQADRGADLDFLTPQTADDLTFIEPTVGRS